MKTKFLLQNVALIVVSLLVALVFFEIGLRVAGFGAGNPFERLLNNKDEFLGYRMIPGDHETINGPGGLYDVEIVSLGFEDGRGFRDDGREDRVHSIFFGDSFVWGYGVELGDSVSEQFESLSGKDAVNLGMTAFTSPTQYARLFNIYAEELRADLAFFGIFMGNDFGDSKKFDDWLLSGKQVSYPEWLTRQIRGILDVTWITRVRLFGYKHIVLWRFLADRIDFGFKGNISVSDHLLEIDTGALDLVLDSSQISSRFGSQPDREISLVRLALERIVKKGRQSGTRPIVFIVPTKELVYQSHFPVGPNRIAEDIHYRTLIELLDKSGIEYVDLLPVFRQAVADGSDQLYFRVDGHWLPAGHALAASELFRYVERRSDP